MKTSDWYKVKNRKGKFTLEPFDAPMCPAREITESQAEKLRPVENTTYDVNFCLSSVGCSFGQHKWFWSAKAVESDALVPGIEGQKRTKTEAEIKDAFVVAAKALGIKTRGLKKSFRLESSPTTL
jgi:hypothetical protein